MIKGHVKIDLHNKNTGRYERIEKENMITNALADVLGIAVQTSNNGNNYLVGNLIPVATMSLGGILLFDGTLTEDATNVHFPMDVHLTGSAGQVSNTASKLTGSINTAESGRTDTGYVNVWDFSTSQANGTIASLSLSHRSGGAAPISGAQYSYGAYVLDRSYATVGYDESRETQYLYYQGKVYKKHSYSNIVRVYSPYLGKEEQVFDFAFAPNYNWQSVCGSYDGYIYAIYVPTVSSTGTVTIDVRKLKISDDGLTEEPMQTVTVSNVTSTGTGDTFGTNNLYAVVSGGHLFFKSYDDTILYSVDLANTADVKAISIDGHKIVYFYPMRGGGLMTTISWQGTTTSGSAVTYYTRAVVYPDGKSRFDITNAFTGTGNISECMNLETEGLVRLYNYNNNCNFAFAANYLGTICNLDSPVIKTSAQSMKITYTLTDVA